MNAVRLVTGSVLVVAVPKKKVVKPSPVKRPSVKSTSRQTPTNPKKKPATTKGTWKTGFGIEKYPTPAKPPLGVTKPCAGNHPETGVPFWAHVLKEYQDAVKAAYDARGTGGAWAAAIKIFMASCCKHKGKKAFPNQSYPCTGKKLGAK
jgi:hypothetical protein